MSNLPSSSSNSEECIWCVSITTSVSLCLRFCTILSKFLELTTASWAFSWSATRCIMVEDSANSTCEGCGFFAMWIWPMLDMSVKSSLGVDELIWWCLECHSWSEFGAPKSAESGSLLDMQWTIACNSNLLRIFTFSYSFSSGYWGNRCKRIPYYFINVG